MTLSTPPVIAAGSLSARPQPLLSAAGGLLLRPWEATDAPVFHAAYQDPELRRWHTNRPDSEDDVRGWFDGYRADWEQERGAHWAVTRGGEVAGRIAARGFDFGSGVAGCAYWVVPAARRAGVASGALAAVSAWAFGPAGFHRLYLDHSTRNIGSCRVATKAGFEAEGVMRSAAVHDDGRHDMHRHARIRV
ncbi:GNAT family N-acetyltransferase [Actinoplanes sp. NPDC051470]|uniref:GNAT family N-acetyltransferase n=1 Tax=Actinoplanes sp. NPDC051470 TaxID=3157224 RepID=UPI003434A183